MEPANQSQAEPSAAKDAANDWHRTGRTSPVDSRTFPGGHALVVRREGGKWEGTITLTVDAGDDAKARAKVDALIARLVVKPVATPCNGPDCMMCSGAACDLCGAGCWWHGMGGEHGPCDHDFDERHTHTPGPRERAVMAGVAAVDAEVASAWGEFTRLIAGPLDAETECAG